MSARRMPSRFGYGASRTLACSAAMKAGFGVIGARHGLASPGYYRGAGRLRATRPEARSPVNPFPPRGPRTFALLLAAVVALAACGPDKPRPRTPAEVRARVELLLPAG